MRQLFVILFTLITLAAFGQTNTNTFYRKYNLSGMQGALGLVEMPDGGFVGTGQHELNGSAGDCDVYVYRIDACGTLLWMKLIGTGGMEGGKSIQRRQNGNLLIVGQYGLHGLLFELDPNGNLLWEKVYTNTTWTFAVDECANGDLIVTGTNVGGQYFVMRTNSTGNTLWSKVFFDLGDYPITAIALSNGNIFINSTFGIIGKDFAAMLMDSTGNILWSRTYGGIGYTVTDYQSWGTKAVLNAADNTVLIVSQTFVFGTDDIVFAKISLNDGSVIWSKVIGDAGSDQARDIVHTRNGYAILGNSDSYPVTAASSPLVLTEDLAERDILLLNLDSLGNLIWAKTYGGIERDKGIGCRWDTNGTFLINAYTSSPVFGNFDLAMDPLFIKTDSNGVVSCQYNTPNVTVQNIVLDVDTAGIEITGSVMDSLANSTISSFVPVDSFQCLQCATVPVFQASDTMVCVSDTIEFYNVTTIGLICFQKWNVDGTLFNGTMDTIRYAFTAPGTYPIKLYSDCGVSTDTFTLNIHVYPPPVNAFSAPDNCENTPTVFTNSSTIPSGNISTWSWDFGDNTTSSSQSPSHTYPGPGNYVVRLSTVSDYGCIDDVIDSITVFPNPAASFIPNNMCMTDSFYAVSTSQSAYQIMNYSWDFGDGFQTTGDSIYHTYQTPGNYLMQLSITDTNNCVDNYSAPLSVHPNPVNNFIAPNNCINDSTPFTNTSNISVGNIVSWNWDFGDNDSSNVQHPTHTYLTPGNYAVILSSVSDQGCTDTVVDSVNVFPAPIASFTPNNICQSQAFQAVSTSQGSYPITNLSWNFGDGYLSSGVFTNHSYQAPGNYNISLSIADINTCRDQYSSMISVFPMPVAIIEPPPRCEVFPEAQFKNHSTGGAFYRWDFGDQETSTEFAPAHKYNLPGTYLVYLRVITDRGCVDSTTAVIDLEQLYNIWIPNAFTPNDDGNNDRFIPVMQFVDDFYMEIYDRWGLKIFTTTDKEYGWDSYIDGKQAQNDVFVYRIQLVDFCGNEHKYLGHFSLLK